MMMPDQRAAQAARRAAREARARVREERVERERRLARAGETVAVELARRDVAVSEHERRAGEALRLMVHSEGLTVRDALKWCGVTGLSTRQALQMMRRLDTDRIAETAASPRLDADVITVGAGDDPQLEDAPTEVPPVVPAR